LDTLVGWAFVSNFSLDGDSFRPMIDYLGYCVGFAIAGFGLSSIFRNQAGAIVAVLVWPLVIEPIIYNILRAIAQTSNAGIGDLANLLPASSGRRTMFRPYDLFSSLGDSDLTVWGLGASTVVYWAGVAIVAVVGSILFVTRDA
ncbi:MAG: hypothetical protein ACRDP4_04525, partial [Nocardioidaceae bacterium]